MKEKFCMFLSALFFLGCSPLEQAPLVYSSAATFGVSTGVNTTETLGFDIVLGYRHVDAAYVPVAVAKKSDNCNSDQKIFEGMCTVVPIAASKSDLRSRSKPMDESDKKTYLLLQTEIDSLKRNISVDEASLKSNQENLLSITDASDPNKIRVENTISSLISSVSSQKSNLDVKNNELRNFKEEFGIGEYAEDGSKKDAYSVYGSFESNSHWFFESQKSTVSNGLRKVFSTGVAAQTLTEAELIKSSYECFAKAEKMTSDTAKEKLNELCFKLVEKQIDKTGQR